MPTELGEAQLQPWRGNYPAMLKEDVPVWELYLNRNPNIFQRIYYNVRIGGVIPGPEIGDEKMRKMYYQNTAKRIDALAEMEKEIWIIEVAARPGLRAVGQLQTYFALWHDDPKIMKTAKMVLVCQSVDSDLERALTIYGVLLRYAI